MKGLIKLTPESLISLVNDCKKYVDEFDPSFYLTKEKRWSWRHFKTIEFNVYSGLPFWYQYRDSLKDNFYELYKIYEQASKFGDEIWLSELAYTHMCLLRDGNRHANPIFIMEY